MKDRKKSTKIFLELQRGDDIRGLDKTNTFNKVNKTKQNPSDNQKEEMTGCDHILFEGQ